MEINFARLNHILIPPTRTERERWRNSRLGRMLRPLVWIFEAATPEGATVLGLAVVAAVTGLDVQRTSIHLLWAVLAGLVVAGLAVSPLRRMRDGRISVRVAPRIAVGEETTFALTLENRGPDTWGCVRLMPPFLPWDGRWSGMPASITGLGPGGQATVLVRGRFVARGEHHLDPFRAGLLAPLGLTVGKNLHTDGCRFVVVPRPARVSRLQLPQGHALQPGGVPSASSAGESKELVGVRPYRAGDPVRDLHARTWARTGVPAVREYRQEYFRRIGVVIDTASGAGERTFEAMVSLAAAVVLRASSGDALVDLLVLGNTLHDLTLGRSLASVDRAMDLLACVKPAPAGAMPDLLAPLHAHLPRLSCVVILCTHWEARHEILAEKIRAQGAAVRAFLVHRADAPAPAGLPGLRVAVEVIERGEALVL